MVCAACVFFLSACGGGSDSVAPLPAPTPEPEPQMPAGNTQKVLLIDLDGLSYPQIAKATLSGEQTGLEGLTILPAWTGGETGTETEQMSSGRPSWATLLTGRWASHGIVWEREQSGEDEALATSLFTTLNAQDAKPLQSAAVVDHASYANLLSREAAAPTSLVNCADQAKVSECVVHNTQQKIADGNDVTVVHLGLDTATDYEGGFPAAIAQLRQALAQRQKDNPSENWLLLVASGAHQDRFGSISAGQSLSDKTVFVATNQALPAWQSDTAAAPTTLSALYNYPSLADIAPTTLAHVLGFDSVPLDTSLDGQFLQSSVAIHSAQAVASEDKTSLQLTWRLARQPAQKLVLLRDGQEIAQLPSDAVNYVDDLLPAQSSGDYSYRYTLVAGDSWLSWPAKISFEKPLDLAPTLMNGLRNYFSFSDASMRDSIGNAQLKPRSPSADGGSLLKEDNFSGRWQDGALRVDDKVVSADGFAGYLLTDSAADITTEEKFTIGFWFRTQDLCQMNLSNGVPILSNKNWHSGGNSGLTIGLWSGCEVQFNLGGDGRIDNKGNKASAGQWVYIALSIDTQAQTFTSYVFDPILGMQKRSTSYKTALNNHLSGLGNGFGLGEDGTGKYIYTEKSAGSPRGTMDYNDFTVWSRTLSDDELESIYRSQRPIATLLQ